ncbi:NAD-dependent formate dehydrogenase iron-sulfur protein [Halopolyspora algeriensis]|uniref:NAD-dependent formate dehydrogenase iron-sulfur protein n=1 Tax=Halopolyspora algeriensis TaxID=1500506 RepID=A0A368VEU5_9ACTN|nr:2Fe-2S iron-sulfur cluster-binding protein [Halopolyspora algeriensis]RCW38790.1 NAD-dependent formate dehydrogenase iron-sulfur protein [Halopolyspora algeriensis]TQM55714.1 NAD-dependent formate dehydrogenase iron-sulfur protein [Halopolyspora algeriensis]
MTVVDLGLPRRLVDVTLDGETVSVPEGSTILDACTAVGTSIPTLCYGDTLRPANACRVCMVEVEGSRTLVPSCSRKVTEGMVVRTDSERTRHSRKLVLELLGSSADLSTTPHVAEWMEQYQAKPERFGPPDPPADDHDERPPGEHEEPDGTTAATVQQPAKVDNDLYVRDYGKCILCYKCVDACGEQWQNTFAIAVAGRGFDARISTEFANPLPDSECVYCGNCIEVCPTGALSFKKEFDMRAEGSWDESRQQQTTTVCTFCGVGCNLTLHTQDNEIVRVTSPHDHSVGHGNLCIKGRFGWEHMQDSRRPAEESTEPTTGQA